MNILLINHYAGSPDMGMEFRPFYMAREWIKMGHNVNIVAASYSHVRTQQPVVNKQYIYGSISGIPYIWIKTPVYKSNNIKRVINIVSFVWRLSKISDHIADKYKPDIVIASSTYPFDIYPARKISAKAGAKLIFEVHDLWPLSPIELGGMPRWHPLIMMMQRAENYAYKNTDGVISILPDAKDHTIKHGLAPEKFFHIPNGIIVEEWDKYEDIPDHHKKIINDLKDQGRIIIGYTGSHGIANDLDTLIEAADNLRNEECAVVLVGKGPEKELLSNKVNSLGLTNVYFLPPVKRSSLPELLSKCDILYIGLKKQSLFQFGVSPNKLFDYMMSGKPVIQAVEASNDIVADAGCGISVAPQDPGKIAEAIQELTSLSDNERSKLGERGKQYVMDNHDYKILAKRFLDFCDQV